MSRDSKIGRNKPKPLEVVHHVEMEKYLGTWYEIATIPAGFQKNCVAVTATYSLRKDGNIEVLNACRVGLLDGPFKSVKGKAWVVDTATNAKLKVRFFRLFTGDYWIIELDPQYRYAVVGHPSRNYLWILSRTPKINDELYSKLLARIARKGYDINRVVMTPQQAVAK